MKRDWLIQCLALSVLFPSPAAERPSEVPTPLTRAHAHNDYLHARPLLDALDHGFCSVEADIYLVDGQLLVAHDRNKVDPRRTRNRFTWSRFGSASKPTAAGFTGMDRPAGCLSM